MIFGLVKFECLFHVRTYWLISCDWSIKVLYKTHNHKMAEVMKGQKILDV